MRIEQGIGKWLETPPRQPEELNNLFIEVMIKGKKIIGRPWNSYRGQIKSDPRVKTFKELK